MHHDRSGHRQDRAFRTRPATSVRACRAHDTSSGPECVGRCRELMAEVSEERLSNGFRRVERQLDAMSGAGSNSSAGPIRTMPADRPRGNVRRSTTAREACCPQPLWTIGFLLWRHAGQLCTGCEHNWGQPAGSADKIALTRGNATHRRWKGRSPEVSRPVSERLRRGSRRVDKPASDVPYPPGLGISLHRLGHSATGRFVDIATASRSTPGPVRHRPISAAATVSWG